jgi:hypothetical protein
VTAFVAVTGLLLVLVVHQRLRIHRVRMTWRSGRVGGIPIWPILFVGVVTVFLVYAQNTNPSVPVLIYGGYLVGGAFWFVALLLSSSSVVTEFGIIPEIGRSGEAVAWGQISDYFQVEDGRRVYFVFIYQDFVGVRRRLELAVPAIDVERFVSVVRSKLDTRIEDPIRQVAGSRALESDQ